MNSQENVTPVIHLIERVRAFDVPGRRRKRIGCNAVLGEHGQTARERFLYIETNTGLKGLGTIIGADESTNSCREAAEALIGRDILDFYEPGRGLRWTPPFSEDNWARRMFDIPMWDLWAQGFGLPLWDLLGGVTAVPVPIYDASLYFTDLLHPEEGLEAIRREVEESLHLGFRILKAKVGRGNRWMSREQGDQQDRYVVRVIRETGGDDIAIWLDANNGYDLDGAMRFVRDVGEYRPALVEEMFPDSIEGNTRFRELMTKEFPKILIADGENFHRMEQVRPFIEKRLWDVIQMDMRMMGFTEYLAIADLAAENGIRIAPHNWGSVFGAYAMVQLGSAVPNLLGAEMDCLALDALDVEAFQFREGCLIPPETPGLGVRLREELLTRDAWVFDIRKG